VHGLDNLRSKIAFAIADGGFGAAGRVDPGAQGAERGEKGVRRCHNAAAAGGHV